MIRTLAGSVREYKKPTILTPILVMCEVALECIIPLIMSMLINEIEAQTGINAVLMYGGILVALAIASLLCGMFAGKTAAQASCGFAKNLRKDMYYKVQTFSFADIDAFSTSSLVTRMTTDVTNTQSAYQMLTRICVRSPLMLIFSVAMSFSISWKVALIFLGIIPVLGIALYFIMRKVHPTFKRIFKKYDALNNSVQENVAGIRVVKSFVREEHEKEKFGKASGEVCKDFTYAEKILALNNPAMMLCMYASMLLVYFVASQIIVGTQQTELNVGHLSALVTYGVQILSSLMMFSMVMVMLSMSMESANRIAEVLERKTDLVNPENGVKTVEDGSVKFVDVSFKYAEKSKKYALQDVNLELKSGETLGIIGGTGSSKTTLIQLISRLYDVTEGAVYVGGKDVREYDLTALRNEVAVVLQKNVLFAGTVKDNLRWGNADATDEEIERACVLACAHEFVSAMPQGYDTHIERGGTNVSGGQKQRLCIARALLKKPKVIVFDDSTSAVDTKTDALIRKAMAEEIPDTTKIIIAQRISSVQDADKIIVMEGGKIAECGTHSELVAKKGIYADIYATQSGIKEADNE